MTGTRVAVRGDVAYYEVQRMVVYREEKKRACDAVEWPARAACSTLPHAPHLVAACRTLLRAAHCCVQCTAFESSSFCVVQRKSCDSVS